MCMSSTSVVHRSVIVAWQGLVRLLRLGQPRPRFLTVRVPLVYTLTVSVWSEPRGVASVHWQSVRYTRRYMFMYLIMYRSTIVSTSINCRVI